MTPEDRIIIRALTNRAIGGDVEARDRLERTLDEAGLDLGLVFDAMGLDQPSAPGSSFGNRRLPTVEAGGGGV